jgi:[methyl-Co(III) methanol-specific corrinoid protein]:coenzyme M methyltransferase
MASRCKNGCTSGKPRNVLIGNISNKDVRFGGTPEDVYRQVRYSIEAGVDILAPECAVPLQSPLVNLKAMVEAAREGYP